MNFYFFQSLDKEGLSWSCQAWNEQRLWKEQGVEILWEFSSQKNNQSGFSTFIGNVEKKGEVPRHPPVLHSQLLHASSCTLSLEFWSFELLLPSIHSHFPEEQNSHLIFVAQPTVTLSQLQEKTGNLGCWHSSWEFWAYKLLPAPIPAPDGCLEFPTFAPERKVFVELHGSIPELFHSLFPWEVGNVHPQHLLDEHGSLEPDPWT